eukprot:gene2912-5391_t
MVVRMPPTGEMVQYTANYNNNRVSSGLTGCIVNNRMG